MGYSFVLIRKMRSAEEFSEVERLLYGNDQGRLEEKFDSCAASLDWYKRPRHMIRRNGVRAVLFSFSYHNSPECDFIKWSDTCKSWLGINFIVNENVLLAWELKEGQEEGHAYAVLVPIDIQEKISYQYYFSYHKDMIDKITSFNDIMAERFHLNRPAKDTMQSLLNLRGNLSFSDPGKELPMPEEGETAQDYRARIQQYMTHRYVAETNNQREEYLRLKEESLEIRNDMQILYRLSKQVGAPDKWGPMLHTAQRLQYAIRSYQENANQEGISAVANILKEGDAYMKKHRIKSIG